METFLVNSFDQFESWRTRQRKENPSPRAKQLIADVSPPVEYPTILIFHWSYGADDRDWLDYRWVYLSDFVRES